MKTEVTNLNNPKKMLVITGSGRSGTAAFAKAFGGFHEYNLREFAATYASKFVRMFPKEDIFADPKKRKEACDLLYCDIDQYETFVDSNNVVSNWVDAIYEKYPQSRFLIVTRNGKDVVVSAINRFWHTYNKSEHMPFLNEPYRGRWQQMDALERCAWFWENKYKRLFKRLEAVPKERVMQTRIEDCNEKRLCEIEKFADIPMKDKKWVLRGNYNATDKFFFPEKVHWNQEMHEKFEKMAGKMQRELGYA